MLKRILVWVLLCASVFWACRIYSINRVKEDVQYYTMQDTIDYDGVLIQPQEAQLYTFEEFSDRFGVSMDDLKGMDNTDGRLLCICLHFSNQTDVDISWDTLMDKAGVGFETTTWGSGITPGLGAYMNAFRSEVFEAGTTQDIWFTTNVARMCFKAKNWKHIREYPFYYVLSLEPEKIKIKLDIGEGV